MSILEIADALERAQRQGADKDRPDSDSALNAMARELRLASADRPDAETFARRQE